ncbi:MAG: ATP-binding protein [Prevotellaceae bacterium]|jgi:hypothetical protein|nr:ATP-binding protein [Prevotellaceae bacterium]
MQAAITIPYAVANFAELRERGYYYVDKTRYIVDLERYKAPIFLRPRRFGKSLLVSMLAYYYDINAADRFERLFGGTYIGTHPTEEHNKYMVLRFDFSTLMVADTIEGLERNFNQQFCSELEGFVHGKASYNRFFEGFRFGGEDQVVTMLRNILSWIRYNDLPTLYILIDEYDNFTNQLLVSYKDPLYEEVTTGESFLRTFFKTINAGIGEGTIRTCFCTGVLPVTMDDLTSGYNIAEILTLEPKFLEMLGFNHEETATYLRYVLDKYGNEESDYEELWNLIVNNYDGYRFLPEARPLFNSTILSYFFKNFAVNDGAIPQEMIDENLRTDVNWIRRLTLSMENAKEMLDALVIDDRLSYSAPDLRSKFNKQKFFDKHFYPVSLYYLGMTTLQDRENMCLPNLTMRSIYMDYYNTIHRIDGDARKYAPVHGRFREHRLLEPLVENYFKEYLGGFPAQVFDKINENFIRCSFFELTSRYLSDSYTFAIEPNLPSGRPDLVLNGVPGTSFHNDCRVVEFKYFKAKEAKRVKALAAARNEDVQQVKGYARDIQAQFPHFKMRTYVVYIAANKVCKVWEV